MECISKKKSYFFFLLVTVNAAPARETAATAPTTIAPTLKSAVWVGVEVLVGAELLPPLPLL
jgi:hypothetical protein